MKSLVIEPLPIKSLNNDYIRTCQVIRTDGDTLVSKKDLWFQFSNSILPPEDYDCDNYLLAVIMDAMLEGRNIVVNGSVSLGLLSNLEEYQSVWNKWLPKSYTIVDIKVKDIRKGERRTEGAICAFSGGVDATFSVWRHSQHMYKFRSQEIKLCSLVHGFDIPLKDQSEFNDASESARNTLKTIGINLVPISTNYREISQTNWEHSFSCALVAALSNFKKTAGTVIVGSSEPYNSLVIPWGSSPITDHLLSSDEFTVIHDGASHSRTEKVRVISDWKVGVKNLRVCWEGNTKDSNCGKCEKCIRTKLNFLATNNSIPDCFPDYKDDNLSFDKINLRNDAVRTEWQQILDYAKTNDVHGPWLKKIKKVIKRRSIIDLVLHKKSLKSLVRKFHKIIRKLSFSNTNQP